MYVYLIKGKNGDFLRITFLFYKVLKYPKNTSNISSFSWHSKDYNRLMVAINAFNLMDLNIADYCAIVRFFLKIYVLYFIQNYKNI